MELLSEPTNLVFSQRETANDRKQETTGYQERTRNQETRGYQERRSEDRDSFFYDDVDNYDELP